MTAWNSYGIRIDGRIVYSVTRDRLQVARHNNNHQRTVYETSVASILETISRRQTGRVLLDEIRRANWSNSHQINIVPFTERDNAASGGNPENQTPFGEINRDSHGNPMTYPGDNPITPQVERAGDFVRGSGEGINPILLFDPHTFTPHLRLNAGSSADEVVFHELVHSKRQIQARYVTYRMGEDYDNSEEFKAVVTTNIYSSEAGATWLRGNHRLPGPFLNPGTIVDLNAPEIFGELGVSPQPSAAQRFAQTYHRELNEFARSDGQFTRRLAEIRVHFNPIREHLINIGAIPRT